MVSTHVRTHSTPMRRRFLIALLANVLIKENECFPNPNWTVCRELVPSYLKKVCVGICVCRFFPKYKRPAAVVCWTRNNLIKPYFCVICVVTPTGSYATNLHVFRKRFSQLFLDPKSPSFSSLRSDRGLSKSCCSVSGWRIAATSQKVPDSLRYGVLLC